MAKPPDEPFDLSRFQKQFDVMAGMQKQIQSMQRQLDLASGSKQVLDARAAFERVGGIDSIRRLQEQFAKVPPLSVGPPAYERFATFNEALALERFREQVDVLNEAGALSGESAAPLQKGAAELSSELQEIGFADEDEPVLEASTVQWIGRLPTATQLQLYVRILNVLNTLFMVVAPTGGNVPDTVGRAAAALILVATELGNHLAKQETDSPA